MFECFRYRLFGRFGGCIIFWRIWGMRIPTEPEDSEVLPQRSLISMLGPSFSSLKVISKLVLFSTLATIFCDINVIYLRNLHISWNSSFDERMSLIYVWMFLQSCLRLFVYRFFVKFIIYPISLYLNVLIATLNIKKFDILWIKISYIASIINVPMTFTISWIIAF